MGKGSGSDSSNGVIAFSINGIEHRVDATTPNDGPNLMLVDYIRDHANLKGTKVMCREGGCGACVVTARVKDAATGKEIVKGINSCMTPVYSCQGWDISTVENLGNKTDGYDQIQSRVVNFYGTQCGYCTPGMVMNMSSLMEKHNGKVTVEDIDKSFDGNICRCTGYRPIMDAFKSLATDAPEELKRKCADIEDCASCPCPMRKGKRSCGKVQQKENTTLTLANGSEWATTVDLPAFFQAIQRFQSENRKTRIVCGNTATGVYKHEGPYSGYIEINGIPELRQQRVGANELVLGGAVTLTEAIAFLNESSSKPGFGYVKGISHHMERVANVPVRNNASIAGNLMIKHAHNDFPSDVFVILEAAGAKITIASGVKDMKTVPLLDFLGIGMQGKLVVSLHFPKRDSNTHFRSYKITRRFQNAHAYVNAAFLIKVENGKVMEKPRIVMGGISPTFFHASKTEDALVGGDLTNPEVLKKAVDTLGAEINPDFKPLEGSVEYRRGLAQALLYKTILKIIGDKPKPNLRMGGLDLPRNNSKGTQVYDKEKSDAVLYKAYPKLESTWQTSGEAEYTGDIPKRPDELFGAFVLSTIGNGKIANIDPTEALKMPGVVRFVSAKDIPGENNFNKFSFMPTVVAEPVFAADKVSYHGQAIGMILAKTRLEALAAVDKVNVKYANVEKPIVTAEDALKKAEATGNLSKCIIGSFKHKNYANVPVKHTVKGELWTGSQYQFFMETLSCVCIPREDGIDVHATTQWMDHCQNALSDVLGIPCSSVNVFVKRLGGGFGGKVSRGSHVAAATGVAAMAARQPVRVVLDIETNMKMMGKRLPYISKYDVGFDDAGRIGSLKVDYFCDSGFSPSEATSLFAALHAQNVYKVMGWELNAGVLNTNTPANTPCRAPGSLQGVAAIEFLMEHIAHYLKKDPLEIRAVNYLQRGEPLMPTPFSEGNFQEDNLIPPMIEELKVSADYQNRKAFIDRFNKENRWRKRGLALVPVRYPIGYEFGANIPATIAIYHYDGTVAVQHGGIEMGQGLQTKVLQTVAQAFQIPMDRIKLKPSNNFTGANALPSGGSVASEVCCFATMRACETLKERLKPILEKLENPSWQQLIAEAHKEKIELSASYTPGPKDNLKGYSVWALALSEVEIDTLTGEYRVVRTDLMEDAGKSLNPGVDIGQIEGGYMFGQGFWTTEKIAHCKETGELLTNRTWEYKVPFPKDVPEDFRITLLKNAPNPNGVLRSKATGEPITDGAVAVYLALRNAIMAARADKGVTDWFKLDGPVTPEDVFTYCLTSPADFQL